jgi:hypothetical protein
MKTFATIMGFKKGTVKKEPKAYKVFVCNNTKNVFAKNGFAKNGFAKNA